MGGLVASRYARKKFDEALASSGITISGANVNLFTRSITLSDLEWVNHGDSITSYPHHLTIKTVYAGGIDLYSLFRQRKIDIHQLRLEDGELVYNKSISLKTDSAGAENQKINGISIDRFVLENFAVKLVNDSLQEQSATIDLNLGNIGIDNLDSMRSTSAYHVSSLETSISDLTTNTGKSMYKTRVGKIHASSRDQEITIDSLVLIPKYSKYRFSRKVGKQLDRFVLTIPKISIRGFGFNDIKDSLFMASVVEIHKADLHIYKDKRLPFVRDYTPLPIALIRKFSFGAAVDSIKIIDSKIIYEEFPEKGFHTGHIVFEKLNATLDHITNRDFYPNYHQGTIKATSRVMGKGVIKAEFSLPYDKDQIYNAKGTISNLAMHRLNPMLESLAFVSIETGRLNRLDFNFDYNDVSSRGSLVINYENLKINSLTREKDSDKNEFKTWVLNMFLKKDKDEDVKKEKRTGKIEYERDKRRVVFQLWVRSLMSGLKSSVLDSPPEKELNQTRKERRDSLKKIDKLRKKSKEAGKQKATG